MKTNQFQLGKPGFRVFTRFWIHAWSPKRVFAMFLDLLCSFALHFSYVSPATYFTTIRQPPPASKQASRGIDSI